MMKSVALICLGVLSFAAALAQHPDDTAYNPHSLFAQSFQPPAPNASRSAKGVPGPAYWQNRADYRIHAALDVKDSVITGDVDITYTNNSPDELDYLWLQLDQNIFRPESRSVAATPYPGDYFGVLGNKDRGYRMENVSVTYQNTRTEVTPLITDTRMQLRLQTPLKPAGDQIVINLKFWFKIPVNGAGRFDIQPTQNGVNFEIAQWYPRMCVYDDVTGWNTLPYLGLGEFYTDFGDYDYFITAPADFKVFGSGDLQNPQEVLTEKEMKKLEQARKSDETVLIVGKDDLTKAYSKSGATKTWHYVMKNTRDVAWTATRGFIWDAARVNLPSGRTALAMSVYPEESATQEAWSRATEYLKHSMEIYSAGLFEYPWNVAINSAGSTYGMEYPGLIFNPYYEKGALLWFLVAHEIGHNWFPMIVCSNERKYMWQDEGFNTYINYYLANDLFNAGEYANAPAYLHKDFFGSLDYAQFMRYRDPLMVASDAMDEEQHFQFYGKTAYGLLLLRNVVVGKERFDYAFKKYTEAWAYKHPTPYDFFNCINNATGEDLNWFWKEWFFTTWKFDQAVTSVNYVENDPAKGAEITLENKGGMVLPSIVQVEEVNGTKQTITLPVEVWFRGSSWTFRYASSSSIKSVILDPEGILPDIDRKNNVWQK